MNETNERPLMVPAEDDAACRRWLGLPSSRAQRYFPVRVLPVGSGRTKRFFALADVEARLKEMPVHDPRALD